MKRLYILLYLLIFITFINSDTTSDQTIDITINLSQDLTMDFSSVKIFYDLSNDNHKLTKKYCLSEEEKKIVNSISVEDKIKALALCPIGSWSSYKDIINLKNKGAQNFHIYQKHTIEEYILYKKALTHNDYPYIVSLDQEGGIVSRMKWFDELDKISPAYLVSLGNPELCEEYAYLVGSLLKSLGINMNMGLVLDLHNFYNERKLSIYPQTVTKYAPYFLKGYQKSGISICATHFPDASSHVDSDNHIAILNTQKEEILFRERYQPIIDNSVDAIMVSNVIFTNVDPNNTASTSKIWITDILCNEMNFSGLIITDDLDTATIKSLPHKNKLIIFFSFC